MKPYNKIWFITGQFFMGLGFGLGAGIVTILIIVLYAELTKIRIELFGEIIGALMGCYAGMLIGIIFDGFKYLKQHDRQKDFLRFLLQSVAGLICGIVVFLKIILPVGREMPGLLANCLLIVLPLAGAVFGFNFGLTPRKK